MLLNTAADAFEEAHRGALAGGDDNRRELE
jgi:hypothetical protein